MLAERAEVLHAVEQEAALDRLERGGEHELVPEARLRLAGDRGEQLAPLDHLGEPAPLLLVGPELGDEIQDDAVHVERQRCGGAALADLEHAERVGEPVDAEAAVLLRHGETEQSLLVQVDVVFQRKPGLAIVLLGAPGERLARQRRDALHDRRLLGLEGWMHTLLLVVPPRFQVAVSVPVVAGALVSRASWRSP